MEIERQKLLKLKFMEQKLSSLLQKIDVEIHQTDMEWLHLKGIVEAKYNHSNVEAVKVRKPAETLTCNKIKHDDESINAMQMNLSLVKPNSESDSCDEESD